MKLVDKSNNEVVATIVANHSMTLDEAIELVGGRYDNDASINGYEDVIFDDGSKYYYDNLVLVV